MKEKSAKIIRIISIPPVMVSVMFIFLILFRYDIFNSPVDIVIDIAMLGVLPVLAYPISKLIPQLAEKGRDGQRKLAFIFCNSIIWMFISSIVYIEFSEGKSIL